MAVYRLSHIVWLIGIAALSTGLCLLCRRKRLPLPVVRGALACLLAAAEIERTLHDGMNFPHHMPFNLCNVSTWATVLALITLWPPAVEFAYFVGLSGAAMTLLTPDMGRAWPLRFFLNHGGTVIAATALIFGRMALIRRRAVWRALGMLAIYAVVLGIFDWIFGANYGFLRRKPAGVTLVNLMGPWPLYIGWGFATAMLLFCLLWIPVRRSAL